MPPRGWRSCRRYNCGSRVSPFDHAHRVHALLDVAVSGCGPQLRRHADLFARVWVLHRALLERQGLFGQVGVEKPGVAGVGAVEHVDEVADEGDETGGEVDDDVGDHHAVQAFRQTAVDLGG